MHIILNEYSWLTSTVKKYRWEMKFRILSRISSQWIGIFHFLLDDKLKKLNKFLCQVYSWPEMDSWPFLCRYPSLALFCTNDPFAVVQRDEGCEDMCVTHTHDYSWGGDSCYEGALDRFHFSRFYFA